MSEKTLMQVQMGTESTWGTVVAPTVKLMGVEEQPTINPGATAEAIPEQRGSHAKMFDGFISEKRPTASLPNVAISYEDICYFLDNLLGEATPSGADPYTRNYAAPLTSDPDPRILSIVNGGPDGVYSLSGAVANKLVFKGETGKPMRMDAEFIGKTLATDALESLSDRTVNLIKPEHFLLYIDAWGGTIGTTAISTIWQSFTLTLENERAGKMGLGSLSPQGYRETGWSGTLELLMEFDATSKAFLDAMISPSALFQKQVRIKAASGANLKMQFDFAGFTEEAPEVIQDNDGVLTVGFTLTGMYNSALGNWFEAENVNQVDDLA